MKSMTYAQKADLVAKCKRVFESVKRSNQAGVADNYRALAIKAICDYELCSDAQGAFDAMKHRIITKPRYRYDNRAGEWVESEEYENEQCAQYLSNMNKAISLQGNTLSALANSYAEQQRRGMGIVPGCSLGQQAMHGMPERDPLSIFGPPNGIDH